MSLEVFIPFYLQGRMWRIHIHSSLTVCSEAIWGRVLFVRSSKIICSVSVVINVFGFSGSGGSFWFIWASKSLIETLLTGLLGLYFLKADRNFFSPRLWLEIYFSPFRFDYSSKSVSVSLISSRNQLLGPLRAFLEIFYWLNFIHFTKLLFFFFLSVSFCFDFFCFCYLGKMLGKSV